MKKQLLFSNAFILPVMMNFFSLQAQQIGIFDGHSDVGIPQHSGSAAYNPEIQEYTVEGSGTNIWFNKDEFHFAWKKIKGDFLLTAKVEFIGKGVEAHRKA
jgi:hypothetical protein